MKIEELIAGKMMVRMFNLQGASLPIAALKRFMDDGLYPLETLPDRKDLLTVGQSLHRVFYRNRDYQPGVIRINWLYFASNASVGTNSISSLKFCQAWVKAPFRFFEVLSVESRPGAANAFRNRSSKPNMR